MLKPYDMLTRCQLELNNSDIPAIDKLQLDMYILRIKIILLDGNRGDRLIRTIKNELEIKDLYQQICSLCGPEGKASDVGEIVLRFKNLTENMKKPQRPQGWSKNESIWLSCSFCVNSGMMHDSVNPANTFTCGAFKKPEPFTLQALRRLEAYRPQPVNYFPFLTPGVCSCRVTITPCYHTETGTPGAS